MMRPSYLLPPPFVAPMITLADIAKGTGLSAATVSRAIRLDQRLSPETVKRVQEEVRRLG